MQHIAARKRQRRRVLHHHRAAVHHRAARQQGAINLRVAPRFRQQRPGDRAPQIQRAAIGQAARHRAVQIPRRPRRKIHRARHRPTGGHRQIPARGHIRSPLQGSRRQNRNRAAGRHPGIPDQTTAARDRQRSRNPNVRARAVTRDRQLPAHRRHRVVQQAQILPDAARAGVAELTVQRRAPGDHTPRQRRRAKACPVHLIGHRPRHRPRNRRRRTIAGGQLRAGAEGQRRVILDIEGSAVAYAPRHRQPRSHQPITDGRAAGLNIQRSINRCIACRAGQRAGHIDAPGDRGVSGHVKRAIGGHVSIDRAARQRGMGADDIGHIADNAALKGGIAARAGL